MVIKNNKGQIIDWLFALILIFLSIVSLSHVRELWAISNSYTYASVLAVSTALLLILTIVTYSLSKKSYVFFVFIILVELFGNIYDAYANIDVNSQGFNDWKELTLPLLSLFLNDIGDKSLLFFRRIIAILNGSFIPIIMSITLHYWIMIRRKLLLMDRINKTNVASKKTPVLQKTNETPNVPKEKQKPSYTITIDSDDEEQISEEDKKKT